MTHPIILPHPGRMRGRATHPMAEPRIAAAPIYSERLNLWVVWAPMRPLFAAQTPGTLLVSAGFTPEEARSRAREAGYAVADSPRVA